MAALTPVLVELRILNTANQKTRKAAAGVTFKGGEAYDLNVNSEAIHTNSSTGLTIGFVGITVTESDVAGLFSGAEAASGATVGLGASAGVVQGVAYYAGPTVGEIVPFGDLVSTNRVVYVGTGDAGGVLRFLQDNTGIAIP